MNVLSKYLNQRNSHFIDDCPLLENILLKIDRDTPTVLFGASEGGRGIYDILIKKGVSVDYFCDNNQEKWGSNYLDTPVISPTKLKLLNHPDILITSSYQSEINAQLNKMKLGNVYHFPLIDIISEKHYDINFHLNHKADISLTGNLFEEEKSKSVYENLIKYRLEKNLHYIKNIRTDDMYIPKIILKMLNANSIIFDIGAFNGDSTESFLHHFTNIHKIIAFEPEINNYEKLKKKFANDKRVLPQNKIISNRVKTFYMSNDGAESKVTTNKTGDSQEINAISIDRFCKEHDIFPNYIKMDVEGFERQVLIGAEFIIKKYKPLLAVSVYHIASDLWTIPKLILSLNNNYNFQLRHHSYNICDSVLYCY